MRFDCMPYDKIISNPVQLRFGSFIGAIVTCCHLGLWRGFGGEWSRRSRGGGLHWRALAHNYVRDSICRNRAIRSNLFGSECVCLSAQRSLAQQLTPFAFASPTAGLLLAQPCMSKLRGTRKVYLPGPLCVVFTFKLQAHARVCNIKIPAMR